MWNENRRQWNTAGSVSQRPLAQNAERLHVSQACVTNADRLASLPSMWPKTQTVSLCQACGQNADSLHLPKHVSQACCPLTILPDMFYPLPSSPSPPHPKPNRVPPPPHQCSPGSLTQFEEPALSVGVEEGVCEIVPVILRDLEGLVLDALVEVLVNKGNIDCKALISNSGQIWNVWLLGTSFP